jgi:hypothetical protein
MVPTLCNQHILHLVFHAPDSHFVKLFLSSDAQAKQFENAKTVKTKKKTKKTKKKDKNKQTNKS